MKKLIAIAVVFTLLVPFAFADVSIGGGAGFGARLLKGDSSEKGDGESAVKVAELGDHWMGFNMTWRSDDGTASARIKLGADTNKNAGQNVNISSVNYGNWYNLDISDPGFNGVWVDDPEYTGSFSDYVVIGGGIWWRPLEILKIEFSDLVDEGVFGRGNAIAWGYQANSAAGEVSSLWGGGWNSFSNATLRSGNGYFDGLGGGGEKVLALSLYPIGGLAVNFAWALGDAQDPEDFFKSTLAQVTYDIAGIGNFALSFKGNDDYSGLDAWASGFMAHTVAADFTYTGLSGMNIGLGAKIPVGAKSGWSMDSGNPDVSLPIEIGLEYTLNQWSGEAFHLYARAGVQLPTEDANNITAFGLDVNPSYDIGMFRVFFDVGVAVAMQKDNDDTDLFWHFNPYIKKGLGIGDLYAGINIWNGTGRGGYESTAVGLLGPDSTKIVNFAIPVYFEYSF